MLLIGSRSSLVVEYEETCERCSIAIEAAVSFHTHPRLANLSKAVDHGDFDVKSARSAFIPCAFAPEKRAFYFNWALDQGLTAAEALVDPNAVVASNSSVGKGSFVNAGAVIGALSRLGEACVINRNTSVGHHCLIGDFVSIGPGATLASNVQVGDGVMIGAGVIVLPNVRIGSGAVISAGTLVRADVADDMLVFNAAPVKLKRHNKARSTLTMGDDE